jgi:hypothetical protein
MHFNFDLPSHLCKFSKNHSLFYHNRFYYLIPSCMLNQIHFNSSLDLSELAELVVYNN